MYILSVLSTNPRKNIENRLKALCVSSIQFKYKLVHKPVNVCIFTNHAIKKVLAWVTVNLRMH